MMLQGTPAVRVRRAAPRTAGQVFLAGRCPADRECPAACYRGYDWGIILLCDHGCAASGSFIFASNPPGSFGGSAAEARLNDLPAFAPFVMEPS